jgi:hypothetical protein
LPTKLLQFQSPGWVHRPRHRTGMNYESFPWKTKYILIKT